MDKWAEVDELVAQRGNLTKLFSALKPLVSEPLDADRLARLRGYFHAKDVGLNRKLKGRAAPDEIYTGGYGTYLEWFTRHLKPDVAARIRSDARAARLVVPNECAIESIGRVDDPRAILRLKRSAPDWRQDLATLGVPPDYVFVSMKLLTTHYHHVHAPSAGTVAEAKPIHAEMPLFGRSSLNLLRIDAFYGPVFLMIVGEAVVQDFDWGVQIGEQLVAGDRIGNFTWGSQTVLLFEGHSLGLGVAKGDYAFVGRRIS